MKRSTTVVAALALAALVGCRTWLELPDDRYFPKRPGFSIEPEAVPENSGLDFDAVYYLPHSTVAGMEAYPGGNYYRFWPNGRVLVTFTQAEGPPSAAEADGFRSAYLGYYHVHEGRVTMEFYAPDAGVSDWYGSVEAFVDKDGNLVKTWSKRGGHVGRARSVFLRVPLAGMKRMPDW